jgi:hypothetical protein
MIPCMNRRVLPLVLILGVAAGIIVGYAFSGIDEPAAFVIAVTTTPLPEPTATDVIPTPTPAPTEPPIIVSLPDCSLPDTPSGSLCIYGSITYPPCDVKAAVAHGPCYKP